MAAKDVSSKQVSGTKTGLLTQKILDHGKYDETLQYAAGLGSDSLARALLHAGVGAGTGYLVGGERGAIGGAAGAALSQVLTPFTEGMRPQDRQSLALIVGGFGSLLAGDASMAGASVAIDGLICNDMSHALRLAPPSAVACALSAPCAAAVAACAGSGVCLAGLGTGALLLAAYNSAPDFEYITPSGPDVVGAAPPRASGSDLRLSDNPSWLGTRRRHASHPDPVRSGRSNARRLDATIIRL